MGKGEAAYEPFETGPITEQQREYYRFLLRRLTNEVDLESLDRLNLSNALTHLDKARQNVGLPFEEQVGFDTARYAK